MTGIAAAARRWAETWARAWRGVIASTDGSLETIAGTRLLRFDGNGLVVEQRDAWAGEAGRRQLPDWAHGLQLDARERRAGVRATK